MQLKNKEHHSAYSRDDIWVIALGMDFQSCFLATSVFYGPSNGNIEICPITKKDVLKAQKILKGHSGPENTVGIRLLNACGELSSIPNLSQNLKYSPLLEHILANDEKINNLTTLVSGEHAKGFLELMMKVSDEFNLNEDQSSVLLSSAKSCIDSSNPITLVHGVY